jgi:hypothetical protein
LASEGEIAQALIFSNVSTRDKSVLDSVPKSKGDRWAGILMLAQFFCDLRNQ